MGGFIVAAIFSGKDTRCNYFPNARVLNDLSTKPFFYSDKASLILSQKWVDTTDIKKTLKGDEKLNTDEEETVYTKKNTQGVQLFRVIVFKEVTGEGTEAEPMSYTTGVRITN